MNDNKIINNQLIVVAGCQRSGTTLTGQILGAHSKTFLIDEPDGLYDWFDSWMDDTGNQDKLFIEIILKASKKYSDERQFFKTPEDLEHYTLILKAPNLSFRYLHLSRICPKPIIVYTIRDVRSVVASMIQFNRMVGRQTQFFKNNFDISKTYKSELKLLESKKLRNHVKAAIIWMIKSSLFDNFKNHDLAPMVMKYENLIFQKERTCKKLAKHCQLTFENNLLNHHKILLGKGPGKTMRDREIDEISILKWKNELSVQEISEIMEIANPLMHKLGYKQ